MNIQNRKEVISATIRASYNLIDLLSLEKEKRKEMIHELKMLNDGLEGEYFELLELTDENHGDRVYKTSQVDIE